MVVKVCEELREETFEELREETNNFWIPKAKYLELKRYCEQYPLMEFEYRHFNSQSGTHGLKTFETRRSFIDPTANKALQLIEYGNIVDTIEKTAKKAGKDIWTYILMAVTHNLTYEYMRYQAGMPASRAEFYDKKRYFFWLLNNTPKLYL